ncbi:MAG: hypothetical protein DRQ55_16595 [Planctomycetota bacterium]|nr:MAG: hypothetical protein DRQ55_16595 [Planctomycetota bacterium]
MDDSQSEAHASRPAWLAARRTLGRIRRRFALDRFDVFTRAAVEGFVAPEGYSYRWATSDDIAGCDEYNTELGHTDRREGEARLEFGHRAVAALHADVVVFTMWENPRNINIPGHLKRRLSPQQSFIYKAFTSPDHRGRGLYEGGMRFVLEQLAQQGKRELVGYAHVKKRISRKGLAALGFNSVGRFYSIDFPLCRRTLVSRELAHHFPESLPHSGVHTVPKVGVQRS